MKKRKEKSGSKKGLLWIGITTALACVAGLLWKTGTIAAEPKEKKNGKTGKVVLIVSLILVLVLAAGTVFYFAVLRDNSPKTLEEATKKMTDAGYMVGFAVEFDEPEDGCIATATYLKSFDNVDDVVIAALYENHAAAKKDYEEVKRYAENGISPDVSFDIYGNWVIVGGINACEAFKK